MTSSAKRISVLPAVISPGPPGGACSSSDRAFQQDSARVAISQRCSPKDARWNAERRAVEFGVEIRRVPGSWSEWGGAFFQRPLPERPTPRAGRRGLLPTANPIGEHRRAENPRAPVDAGTATWRSGGATSARAPPYTSDKVWLAQQAPKIVVRAMFTKDILFGMNILTLAGFVVMGLSLTLHRMAAAGRPLAIGLMCAGTALVFLGLYAGGGSR
jgi:hypothetical protein